MADEFYTALVQAATRAPACVRCDEPTNQTTGVTIEVKSTIGVHQHQLFCLDCYCRFIQWCDQKPGKLHGEVDK